MSRTRPALLALAALPAAAAAQPIPITNAGFESPVMAPNAFTQGATGWTTVPNSGADWGVFYPTVATWGYAAPEGHQDLYLNGGAAEQTLGFNAQAGTYTLRVDVINRPNFGGHPYFIELYAGATLLARDGGALVPPSGSYQVSAIVATVPAGSPVIGQPLRIRLGGNTQTNFDDVRLMLGGCYANCDGSTTPPVLNVSDFTCFLNKYAAGDPLANCDSSTVPPVLNVNDFICFQQRFAQGCQ